MSTTAFNKGDTVVAQCGSCGMNHVWVVVGEVRPTKVTMQRGWKDDGCRCARQTASETMVKCTVTEVVV